MCGGTDRQCLERRVFRGLSPRVRGNLSCGHSRPIRSGTIPACAGEPRSDRSSPRLSRDYPRVCGGTSGSPGILASMLGLSPRVRGNRVPAGKPFLKFGTIPACAGEPGRGAAVRRLSRDYPRVCGGTASPPSSLSSNSGLSPRVRGNRRRFPGGDTLPGTIPACAGEPAPHRASAPGAGDYPRVCGGTFDPSGETLNVKGLSPRVRGNRADHVVGSAGEGTIPACAGEPSVGFR